MNKLGGSHHMNFLISGAVEFPAYILVMIGINSWGRQPVQSLSILVAGTALILTALVPHGMHI
jgi:OCT family organic cation transporter-like MFS transporter 4/5